MTADADAIMTKFTRRRVVRHLQGSGYGSDLPSFGLISFGRNLRNTKYK